MALATRSIQSDDLAILDELIAQQEQLLLARTTESARLTRDASPHLAGGVASSWQAAPPCPVWVDHGLGARVWDVDGTEYVDLHNGFGAMLVGHAHPAVVRAVQARIERGSHFAQPTEDVITVSTELARRFGLPLW